MLVKTTVIRLLRYCRENDWAGYDPYDALNSRIFRALPFLNFRLARLVLTQTVKRSPINLRPMLMVPKTTNPKAIALFLSSLVRMSKISFADEMDSINSMAGKLLDLRSPGIQYSCWGYSFDWQQRSVLVPKSSPNIICTTFAGNALLDAFELTRDRLSLEAAISAAEFILDKLFWRETESKAFFRYTLTSQDKVHNANLLGAAFLCRVGRILDESKFIDSGLEAAHYSVGRQHLDGSWDYGEAPAQHWVDNFHTGFNLVALRRIYDNTGMVKFDSAIRRGFLFYRAHFFREDGAPRYFHKTTYPIDIHSVAQSLITLAEFKDFGKENVDQAYTVLRWALNNLWDKRGFFYFQKRAHSIVRTPFMRWSQAWMLLALTNLMEARENAQQE